MDAQSEGMTQTINFRCLPKYEPILPQPMPAKHGLPDWLREMPASVFSKMVEHDVPTVKQCPPFIDAMTCGFLMLLPIDLIVDGLKLSWERNALGTKTPISFHENIQAAETPFFDTDRPIVKFNNFWMIETPPDYSLLVTHPINRNDLPFVTLTGLVDTDCYNENFINFPARWRDINFRGVLPRGTPVAQVIPVKRESWTARFGTVGDEGAKRLLEVSGAMASETGIYRKQFRVSKR